MTALCAINESRRELPVGLIPDCHFWGGGSHVAAAQKDVEMKRGTPDHWKMKDLAVRLRIPRKYAITCANGIMERLWHYTAKYAPQGDIGRVPDEHIADACGWPTEHHSELVAALVGARWLDRDAKHRLIVHDWHDHADESVKKTLKNKGLQIIFPENSSQPDGKFQPAFPKPFLSLSSPMPEPAAQGARVANSEARPSDGFDAYIQVFLDGGKPINDRDREKTLRIWLGMSDADKAAAHASAESTVRDSAHAQFVPLPQNHLSGRPWTRNAPQRVTARNTAKLTMQEAAYLAEGIEI